MKTDEYVPSEDDMRHAYWLTRMLDHHADVDGAFDRFLARVRRDAARSALDGLAMEAAGVAAAANRGKPWVARTVQGWARDYRDTHYPEETPND